MKRPFLLIMLLTVACDRNDFSSADSVGEAYQIRVEQGEGESIASDPSASDAASDEAAVTCARHSGLSPTQVRVNGSQKIISISPDQALAIKVTGNSNTVSLDLSGQPPETELKAICLFMAGNQNRVTLALGIHLNALFVQARGNKSRVDVDGTEEAVISSVEVDAKGNGSVVTLKGGGTYPCDQEKAGIVCEGDRS